MNNTPELEKKRYKRSEAIAVLKELTRRVKTVNNDKFLSLNSIPLLIVFGSYARGAQDVGDLDVTWTTPLRSEFKKDPWALRVRWSEIVIQAQRDGKLSDNPSQQELLDFPGTLLRDYLNFHPMISSHYSYEFFNLMISNLFLPFKIVVGNRKVMMQQAQEIYAKVRQEKADDTWEWPPKHSRPESRKSPSPSDIPSYFVKMMEEFAKDNPDQAAKAQRLLGQRGPQCV